jgi:hypothetical protein
LRAIVLVVLVVLMGWTVSGCGDDGPTAPEASSIPELFGTQLFEADGTAVGVESLDDTALIGIYFASAGCSACGAFTPLLVDAYQQWREEERSFEVVLVSLGITDSTLFGYMTDWEMPWLAVSSQSSQANALVQTYNVRWVPTLVVIDGAGRTVSMNGRDQVTQNGAEAYDAWSAGGGGG